jgi:Zn-dependent protease with chaperone function
MILNRIPGLTAEDYEHPLEAHSLDVLKNTRGIGKVVNKFYELGIEKAIKLQYTGGNLKATSRNFSHLIYLAELASDILGVTNTPDLYIQRSEDITSISLGVENPIIVLSSESIEKLSNQELLFMIGREVAHIKSNHTLYQEIGIIFPELMDAFSVVTLGISSMISTGLRYALYYWSQMAEYSADRGGLLVVQDPHVVKFVLAKIAGLPEKNWDSFDIEEFEIQAKSFEGYDQKTSQKIIRYILGENSWAVARTKEIIQWIDSGEYQEIIDRKPSALNT